MGCRARRGCNAEICRAKKLNHRDIVRVLRAYRYFQYHPTRPRYPWLKGYLFIECIPGPTLEQEGPTSAAGRLAEAVLELSSVADDENGIPGPFGGGKPLKGYWWVDDGTKVVLNSVDDLNYWLNKRVKLTNEVDLRPYPFVLCNLDLSSRNIKLMRDYNKTNSNYSIYLLDWGPCGPFSAVFRVGYCAIHQ